MSTQQTTSIVSVNKPSTVVCHLICFHHVGGSGNTFRFLSKEAEAKGIKLYCAALPGRNGRNTTAALTTVPDIVHAFAHNLKALYASDLKAAAADKVPIMFLGHSLGAIVAFELARRELSFGYGFEVSKLVLSAAKSPEELSFLNQRLTPDKILYTKSDQALMDYIQSIGGKL